MGAVPSGGVGTPREVNVPTPLAARTRPAQARSAPVLEVDRASADVAARHIATTIPTSEIQHSPPSASTTQTILLRCLARVQYAIAPEP